MDPASQLHPGQQELTPDQEAEARRFAEESIRRQLSTEPVNEQEVEAFLREAYEMAGLAPPAHIRWVDGPLQLLPELAALGDEESVLEQLWGVENSARASIFSEGGEDGLGDRIGLLVSEPIYASLGGGDTSDIVEDNLWNSLLDGLWDGVGESREDDDVGWDKDEALAVGVRLEASITAYEHAYRLAFFRFFDVYLAPNALHALAHFNELVSGYWLGREVAFIVRRPTVLSRDAHGRLHSEMGKCTEYRDGWGFWAWHGVRVPEYVIVEPESLTREDFLNEPNVEVRRVMQQRMGQRFVGELGGIVLDSSPGGTLYEVELPDDPEQVAHYVQLQDASPERQYFLRVPPTIQTATEAVAWSFGLSLQDYHPADET
jgi:hypothetical protein